MKHFHAVLNQSLKFTGSIRCLLIIVLSLAAKTAISQGDIFVDVTGQQFPGLPQLINSTSGWADYDGDGRPDLLIAGRSTTNKPVSKLYRNTAKGFVDVSNLIPGLPQVFQGSIAWGDYNNDGKPDFFICGNNGSTSISKLYQNTGNGFVDKSGIVQGLLGFSFSSAAWGNSSNSGFPSLIVIGYAYDSTIYDSRPTTRLYESNGNSLYENTGALPDVPQLASGTVDWADYDHDGFTDLTISGYSLDGLQTRVYHNGKGLYWEDRTNIIPDLPSLSNPSLAWVDFNKNGQSGLIITGQDASRHPVTKVYTNLSNHSFSKQSPGIVAVDSGAVAWGDYDRDGRPDLLISGSVNGTPTTKLYHNTKNGFIDVTGLLPGVPGLAGSAAAWGDYDKDGWLDVMITGDMLKTVSGHRYFGALYHNMNGNGFEDKSVDLSVAIGGPSYMMGYGSISWMPVNALGYPELVWSGDAEGGGDEGFSIAPARYYLENHFYNPPPGKGFSDASKKWDKIPLLKNSSMDWADFNKDGLIDLMIIGKGKANNSSVSQLLKQVNSASDHLNDVTGLLPGLPVLNRGSVKWGDYDNDGWPDLAVCGLDDAGTPHTLIYHNEKGTGFTNVSSRFPNLPAIYDGSVAWGDYDNDGRADLLLAGLTSKGPVTMLYHSEANGFTDRSDLLPDLPQVGYSTVSFADVNNDGLVDILVTGRDNNSLHTTLAMYYNSTANITLKADTTLLKSVPGFSNASIAAGDYDNDGKTDIFITGQSVNKITSVLYHNTGYGFEDKSAILPIAAWYNTVPMGVYGSASFVDYDLSGRQGLFLTGENSNGTVYSSLWRSANTNANSLLPDLQGIADGSSSWGDYDNDGKPDLFITGVLPDGHTCFTKLYHNLGAIFEDKTSLLPGLEPVYRSAVAWGDYDNDGRIDLFIMGSQGSGARFIKLYHNTVSGFNDVSDLLPGLVQLSNGDAAWGDYDNDGKLDLIISGVDVNNKAVTLLYHNKGNGFEDAGSWSSGLPAAGFGTVAWADYNNDGRQDLFIAGIKPLTGDAVANLYYNTGSGFALDENWVNQFDHIPGLSHSAAAWGDYNNDGWVDLFLSGETSTGTHVTKLMQNSHGYFIDVSTNLPGLPTLSKGSAAWGDFDNDGLRDLVLTGQDANAKPVIRFYRDRDNGLFADVTSPFGAGLAAVQNSSVAVADYDNDGNLDFMVTGDTGAGYSSTLYHNPLSSINTTPAAPSGLSSAVSADGKSVTLTWKAQIPSQGLNYNIYVGTTSGGQDVVSPMADLNNGYRRVIQLGNSQTNSYTIKDLSPGKTYYWSVQAIDATYKGSNFSAEQKFVTSPAGDGPVTIIDTITAINEGRRNRIDWNTLYEETGNWFKVEKSYLNGPFVTITDKVYTHGAPSSYFVYDPLALQGKNSYRIKTYDQKGNFKESEVVSVYVSSHNDSCTLTVFPNPVHDLLNITFDCKSKFGGIISIVNQKGKTVMRARMTGGQTVLNLAGLPDGIYYIQYNNGFSSERRKVIKL